ncbi:UbiX family flavin prenyltransferase [Thermosphaera aggregans]|uniref:Flavin prenyltransferase UbiX n=1 Tax=Thermosphaera aggregans (strain DSM 11486 / M11TL) TaxID=633148 RepID=D5U2U8_THEAM|nr:UbiX family flavin prenyltransferase [Thermosphaera aggregans]ADG91448.1 3-octaprenyl-4-hydroxybenzoate carboxy-lyase [Thermosphaera aggregans DSM 11486]
MNTLIIGITGASGIVYSVKLVSLTELLGKKYDNIYVVYTRSAEKVSKEEMGLQLSEFLKTVNGLRGVYHEDELESPLASSSRLVGADMVVVPASMNTVAKLAAGIQDNLLLRAAISVLRLKGKLVIVPRETPLSPMDLRNLYRLSVAGAVILPASPGFYHRPRNMEDIVFFVVGKILDSLGIEHNLYLRWKTG